MPEIGEKVVLQGTGRRWSGVHYHATVVDSDDDTVKVRYADGGYKRFPKDKYTNLIVKGADDSYRFRAYELFEDQYDPTSETVEKASALRSELQQAVRAQDFLKAASLKKQIAAEMATAEKINDMKRQLLASVQEENFEESQRIKDQIAAYMAGEHIEETSSGVVAPEEVDMGAIFEKARKRALGGGMAGAAAMGIQVGSLMWMRTTMNYQYRYGTTTREAIRHLYAEGGIPRFYKGVLPALIQGPMSRFGDTASNTGMLALMNSHPSLIGLPIGVKTMAASSCAASFRIFLMPVDAIKTGMQVEGSLGPLMNKIKAGGPLMLYQGSLGAAAATFAGHFPWWFTYNFLDGRIPQADGTLGMLGRQAGMGFCASIVSDTTSNSIRVIKTVKQTSEVPLSYVDTVKTVIAKDGLQGLFLRGLGTRLLSNALQGVMFSVLWKYIDKTFFQKN
jgi:hypothetical protein